MKLSARNQFKGTIVDIQEGAVNGIVKIDIGGGNVMSATISMNAIRELGLKVGGEAYAVVTSNPRKNRTCRYHPGTDLRICTGVMACEIGFLMTDGQASLPSSMRTRIVPPQTMPSDSATSPVRSMSKRR